MSNLNAGNWDSGNMFGWLEDLLIPVKEKKGEIHESIRDSEGKNS
ncbi:hypothetical protein [Paenibacillus sp. alder61]|nr:hypothetical protein [Paenibacillus sp. alder61]